MSTSQKPATSEDIQKLRGIIERADEDLQRAIAAVMRARATDDRQEAFDTLERARAALSHWLPTR